MQFPPFSLLQRLTFLALAFGVTSIGQAQAFSQLKKTHDNGSPYLPGTSLHQRLSDPAMAKPLRKSTKSLTSPLYAIDTAIIVSDNSHYPAFKTRGLYDFDAQGNRLSELYQNFSFYDALTGQYWVWGNDFRCISTYDAQGNRLSYLEQWWLNDQWLNSDRLTSTCDAQGNELTRLEEWWVNAQWVNLNRFTYTYDASGNVLSQLGEYWSYNQWVWLKNFRYTSTYDGQGNELSRVEEWWWDSLWVNTRRYAFTYDEQGKMLSDSTQSWSNGQWVNQGSHAYAYDAYGNPAGHTYIYDANGNILQDSTSGSRTTFSYDGHGNVTTWSYDSYHYDYLGYGWWPENANFAGVDGSGNMYNYWGSRDTLHYRMIATDITSEGEAFPGTYSLSQNYPNPFNPSTTIQYAVPRRSHVTLTVYNMLGQQVKALVNGDIDAGYHTVRFDASHLASGMYFYRLQAGSFGETKRLLLVR